MEISPFIRTNNNENRENTIIIWFEPDILNSNYMKDITEQLHHINDYVLFYTDLELCINFIQSNNKYSIFLIVSGISASSILKYVQFVRHIETIFIFQVCLTDFKRLLDDYPKIINLYTDIDLLCISLREQINLVEQRMRVFFLLDRNDKLKEDFSWMHLLDQIILHLPQDQQPKTQLISVCRRYYENNIREQQLINEFEEYYQSEEAIRWYTRSTFISKLLSRALQTGDIPQLYLFRFFIRDLSEQLAHEHKKILENHKESLIVYHAAQLPNEEFKLITESIGELMSANSYIFANRLRSIAFNYIIKRKDIVPVIFEIECNIKSNSKDVIFADITQFNDSPDGQNILFDISTTFRLNNIHHDGDICVIKMTAFNNRQTITGNWIQNAQRLSRKTSVAVALGRLLYNFGEYDKSLHYKKEFELAEIYYHRAYNRMLNVKQIRRKDLSNVLTRIGCVLYKQYKLNEALEFFQRVIKIDRVSDQQNILKSFSKIGLILNHQGKYNKALEYFHNAVKIEENLQLHLKNHQNFVINLNNIAFILYYQQDYDKSLGFIKRAIKTREMYLPVNELSTINDLNRLADVLYQQGNDEEALINYQLALELKEMFYPENEISIVSSLQNISNILYKQEKYDQALESYRKSLKIQEKFYPYGHVFVAYNLYRIGLCLCHLDKYDQALEYCQRALVMRERCFPTGYIDIMENLETIGHILSHQTKYDEALRFYHRSFEIQERYYSLDHKKIAINCENIARIYYNQEKYDQAMIFYQKTLKIMEEFFPHGSNEIADILTLIGLMYSFKQEIDCACDYLGRSLCMKKQYAPNDFESIMTILQGLALVYIANGNYQYALMYAMECLKVRERFLTDNYIEIATNLNIIGMCYTNLGDRKLAMKYYKRALSIFKQNLSVGDPHIEITERNIRQHLKNIQLLYKHGRNCLYKVKTRLLRFDI